MTTALLNLLQLINLPKQRRARDERVFGPKQGILTRIIGCRHKEISRPFGAGDSAYRSCLSCGARKPFNATTLETGGSFYCPPAI